MPKRDRRDRIHARTVWISDVHPGFRGCSADLPLDFLHRIECDGSIEVLRGAGVVAREQHARMPVAA